MQGKNLIKKEIYNVKGLCFLINGLYINDINIRNNGYNDIRKGEISLKNIIT